MRKERKKNLETMGRRDKERKKGKRDNWKSAKVKRKEEKEEE